MWTQVNIYRGIKEIEEAYGTGVARSIVYQDCSAPGPDQRWFWYLVEYDPNFQTWFGSEIKWMGKPLESTPICIGEILSYTTTDLKAELTSKRNWVDNVFYSDEKTYLLGSKVFAPYPKKRGMRQKLTKDPYK